MARTIILAATVAILFCLYLDRPKPVEAVEVKYCPVTHWTRNPDSGRKVWYESWGPCKDMDRYEDA